MTELSRPNGLEWIAFLDTRKSERKTFERASEQTSWPYSFSVFCSASPPEQRDMERERDRDG